METRLVHGTTTAIRNGERGAALILALMVSLVLVFLGLGLLLQTSLGLQASGTDRWVTKALYAAEAGAMMQIEMIQMGVLGAPSTFMLEDDPNISGLLKSQFAVTVTPLLRPSRTDRLKVSRRAIPTVTSTFAARRAATSGISPV